MLTLILAFVLQTAAPSQAPIPNPQSGPQSARQLMAWVDITGEVAKPGRYGLSGPMRIVDLIERAGGVTDKARRDAIEIRHALSVGDSFLFDYAAWAAGRYISTPTVVSYNVDLMPMDLVTVLAKP